MSRTYRQTNGSSKKLKDDAMRYYCDCNYNDNNGDYERRKKSDYNDHLDSYSAIRVRMGKYSYGVPKYYRKTLNKNYNTKIKRYIYFCIKYENHYDRKIFPVEKNCATYNYY